MDRLMEHRHIEEHYVVLGFLNSQVGPKAVMALGQNDVGLVKPLRVVVANVEKRYAIGEGIVPENLIHSQLADGVRLVILAKTLDADDQVTDVIIHFASCYRRREFALQPHRTISDFLGRSTPPTRLRPPIAAGFCRLSWSLSGTFRLDPFPRWPSRRSDATNRRR